MLIRSATLDDAAAIAEIYRPIVECTTISFELEPPDEAEMRSRVVDTIRRYPWLVAVHDGHVAGYPYASRHRKRAAYASSVDVSAYVNESARRAGIGRNLYDALFDRLAQLGFHRAFAAIALPNEPSIAFHKSLGFELIGVYREVGKKFERWIDVSWWQRPVSR